MSHAARAAELIRRHGLGADALVVHVGAGGVEVLQELNRLGCRVLALDPAAPSGDSGVDVLRVGLTQTVARLVRARYGPVRLLLAAADVPAGVASLCLAADGVVASPHDEPAPLPRAA